MATSGSRVPPPPPRLTGNVLQDLIAIVNWLWDFYRAAVLEEFFLNVDTQAQTGTVTITNLPDPANTNLATAQKTANDAYQLANTANTTANAANNRTKNWRRGTVTIENLDTNKTVTLSPAEPDTNYMIVMQVKDFEDSPDLGATQVIRKVYSTGSFQFFVNAAPGAATDKVTFEWLLIRDITVV